MNNFVQGIRGTHKEDKYGRQMAMMAKTTSGTELQDIIAYISYLGTIGH
jgi:cytochrome c oxidase subunit 2